MAVCICHMQEEEVKPLVSDIQWLPPLRPKEKVIRKIQEMHFTPDKARQATVDKFWNNILEDLHIYESRLNAKNPFEHTCYKCCSPVCVRRWDRAYWEFKVAGLRKRAYISSYKFPVKLVSVIFVFVAGIFRLVRANQDGKASFYANVINLLTNTFVIAIYWLDGERVMLLPKIGAIVVSIFILNGILKHAHEEGVGL